ncbi:MAG TPA: hypothetical protein VF407_02265 [Polyangiaceae bacterium]
MAPTTKRIAASSVMSTLLFATVASAATSGWGCSHGCDAPDHVEYDRDPQSANLPGCAGDTSDVGYPEGTTKTLPECLAAYDGPKTCTCHHVHAIVNGSLDDHYEWSCPV